jgi:hypothetical protein
VSFTVNETAMIVITVGPEVIAFAIGEVLLEKASKSLSVLKSHRSVAPFHEIFELSLVS